jgi:osmotically-inducible protein OsmY
MDNDRTLQQYVIDELQWEPRVDPAHIGVAVDSGIVTLSGHVGSYAEKRATEKAANRVRGIKAVAQEIEVRLPFEKKCSDDEIAERAVKILDWEDRLPDGRIQLKVEHGVVTLTGLLDWQYQKNAAEQDVHKLTGVISIDNRIVVKPMAESTAVHEQIVQSLRCIADLDAKSIEVAVSGRCVTLSGRVRASYERDLAWSAPGVNEVVDTISVG